MSSLPFVAEVAFTTELAPPPRLLMELIDSTPFEIPVLPVKVLFSDRVCVPVPE
jgi:hypothetical protein